MVKRASAAVRGKGMLYPDHTPTPTLALRGCIPPSTLEPTSWLARPRITI